MKGRNMTKNDIKKQIINFSMKKIVIIAFMLFFICGMIICGICSLFSENYLLVYFAVGFYIGIIIMAIFASRLNLKRTLADVLTHNDYKFILEYILDSTSYGEGVVKDLEYTDGLYILKGTFNKMYTYHMDTVNKEYFKKHISYMYFLFNTSNDSVGIPDKLLNKEYLRNICETLLKQFENEDFCEAELEQVKYTPKTNKKINALINKLFVNGLNIALIIFVIIKFIITSSDQWYENVNNYKWLKYIYNLSTDLIAASLAFISLKKKD